MTTRSKRTQPDYDAPMEEIQELIGIIEAVAKGNYSNDVMEFTKPGHSETIQKIAEAMGMMMIRVEAREVQLEQMIEELRDLNARLQKNITQTAMATANALGARDAYTKGHAYRVSVYSERLARRMELPEKEIEQIRIGGMLHDIGKIGFSDRIFSHEDVKLSEGMLEEIKRHPDIGMDILKDLTFLETALDYVHHHHECLDGTGYPEGLKGEEILIGARIISVADCFDAITTDRSYQKGRTTEEAFAILKKISGKNLSPDLVELFIEEINENGKAAA